MASIIQSVMRLALLLLLRSHSGTPFVPPAVRRTVPTILHVDKGFNLLEQAIIPQGALVATVKGGWKLLWKRMMAELAPQDKDGNYERPKYSFDGKIGSTDFPDEAGRYHVYLGGPCPWCHRVKLTLNLRGINNKELSVTQLIDDPTKASRGGWILNRSDPDPLFSAFDLRGVYDGLCPGFQGRCTAPLLVDKKTKQIVSNESADIVRMLNNCNFGNTDIVRRDLVPPTLVELIDSTNEWTYELLNNAVYRCGFSTTQKAYDKASYQVLQGLERCNEILSENEFLCGSSFTEADVRLLPTILRFDGAYAPLFKAGGVARIKDYPHLFRWLKQCWAMEGIPESIDLAQACGSYYAQLFPLNPGGIIPTPPTAKSLGLT